MVFANFFQLGMPKKISSEIIFAHFFDYLQSNQKMDFSSMLSLTHLGEDPSGEDPVGGRSWGKTQSEFCKNYRGAETISDIMVLTINIIQTVSEVLTYLTVNVFSNFLIRLYP